MFLVKDPEMHSQIPTAGGLNQKTGSDKVQMVIKLFFSATEPHHQFQKRKLSFSLQTPKKTVTLLCRTPRTSRQGDLSSEVGGGQWVRMIRLCIERGWKDVPSLMGLRVLPLPKEVSSVTTSRLSWVSLLGDSAPWMPS